jgi:hypothetical protein
MERNQFPHGTLDLQLSNALVTFNKEINLNREGIQRAD